MGKMQNLVGKLEGKIPLRGPRSGWKYNIQWILKK
jgi:hypothetical protein